MAKPPKNRPTQQERALADVSEAQWNDYVNRYRPAEKALMERSKFTEGERKSVEGQAAADAAAAFKDVNRTSLAAAGAKQIGSGGSKMNLAKDASALGKTTGLAREAGVLGGRMDSEQQRMKITAFGRGLAHDATANMARGAQRASRLSLAAADARFQSNLQKMELASTVAGAGYRKWKGMQEYNAEVAKNQKRYHADRVTPDTLGEVLPGLDDVLPTFQTNPLSKYGLGDG